MEDETSGLCIEKMHTTFFLFYSTKEGKRAYIKNLKPQHNTYRSDNE
jgi:hypothetical protein